MKVGLITFHTFSQPGGVKRHVLALQKEFIQKGLDCKVIVPRRSRKEDYGKDVILLGTSIPLNLGGSQTDFDVNFNPISVRRVLKEENFDVLHFHNVNFPSAIQIVDQSRALNILTFHANVDGSVFLKSFPIILSFLRQMVNWRVDGIIGVADLNLKVFKTYRGPTKVIPNGIDLKRFNEKAKEIKKYKDGKFNILYLGRIEERKGLIYLLRAYKILERKFDNLRLIVVGEGDLKKEYKKYAKENKLKNVEFVGEITEDEIASYYKTANVFVSPAIYGESFGMVLLEAMACGTPVAGFSNKGYKAFLDGKCCEKFLAEPKDYKALAEKVEILIKDNKLRETLSKKVIVEAKDYSWENIANQVLSFYKFCKQEKRNNTHFHFKLTKSIKSK